MKLISKATMRMLIMPGTARTRASKEILRPSFLAMTLRGLNTLSNLRILTELKLIVVILKDTTERMTTKKSS